MIHLFNPGHEMAVHNKSPYYMAPANVALMQSELAFLPAWYAHIDDYVLIQRDIDKIFREEMKNKFGYFPYAIDDQEIIKHNNPTISLWGISPQAIHFFVEISKKHNIRMQIPQWHDEFILLNSRSASKECLSEIISQISDIENDIIPIFVSDIESIKQILKESKSRLLAKAPYSSSGRGLLWLPTNELPQSETQILHGILKKQGSVSIERVVDKQLDFAMEFDSKGNGVIQFIGYSLFSTNQKGAYTGNYIGSQFDIQDKITRSIPFSLLNEVKNLLINILSAKYAKLYKGCIGVDMMIYKTEKGEYKLHPCVEINMRANMGLLAYHISENYLHPQSEGQFRIDFCPIKGDIYQQHKMMENSHPAVFADQKLASGYLPLCAVDEENRYWAYILVKEKSLKTTSPKFSANNGCSNCNIQ